MPIGEICVRDVVTATRDTTIFEASQLMRVNHVGDLLVVEGSNGSRAPVGIITDRDIVVAVVALKLRRRCHGRSAGDGRGEGRRL